MNEKQELTWIYDHFTKMLAFRAQDERKIYMLQHPILFSFQALKMIQDNFELDADKKDALTFLDGTRLFLWKNPENYPLGYGPLEKIQSDLKQGLINFNDAMIRCKEISCSGQLSHTYIRAIMLKWVDLFDYDVDFAYKLAEIALEATLAIPLPTIALDVKRAAAEGFIRMIHWGLMKRPSGRYYYKSIELGEWAINDAKTQNNTGLVAVYLHEIGTLILDAYAANLGPSIDYPNAVRIWLSRSIDPMPDTILGLSEAIKYLSASIEVRKAIHDPELGKTYKAILEAHVYKSFAEGKVPAYNQIKILYDEAILNLDPTTDGILINRVNDLLSICI